jgi:hypothetical protein
VLTLERPRLAPKPFLCEYPLGTDLTDMRHRHVRYLREADGWGSTHSFRTGTDRKVEGLTILLISCRSRFTVLERRLFVGGHTFFGHRQDHGDADIGPGHRRQIDDLLFAEKRLGPIEQLV